MDGSAEVLCTCICMYWIEESLLVNSHDPLGIMLEGGPQWVGKEKKSKVDDINNNRCASRPVRATRCTSKSDSQAFALVCPVGEN